MSTTSSVRMSGQCGPDTYVGTNKHGWSEVDHHWAPHYNASIMMDFALFNAISVASNWFLLSISERHLSRWEFSSFYYEVFAIRLELSIMLHPSFHPHPLLLRADITNQSQHSLNQPPKQHSRPPEKTWERYFSTRMQWFSRSLPVPKPLEVWMRLLMDPATRRHYQVRTFTQLWCMKYLGLHHENDASWSLQQNADSEVHGFK